MALSQAANLIEKVLGDKPTSVTADEDAIHHDGPTHLACTWNGLKSVKMQQVPLPKVVDPQDVLVNVTGSTVCGSDLHLYKGGILQLKKGDVLGHEAMGVVADVGAEVKKVKKGDRVVIAFSVGCGTCQYCKEGLTTMCENTNGSKLQEELWGDNLSGIQGYSHFLGGYSGCQSETVRVPYGDLNTLVIPDSVPDEKALYLSDIVCTSYHNVVDTGFEKGQTAAIWGAGPIGLHVAQWLTKVFGASKVVILDMVPSRLELAAKEFGVETIDISKLPSGQTPSGAVREIFPSGVDVAFDTAGFTYAQSFVHKAMMAVGLETDSPEVLNEAIKATRKFGRVGIVADYAALANGFNIGALMEKGIKLMGNGQAPVQKYWQKILDDYIIPGKFRPEIILTHRFKIDECDKVYDAFDRKVFDDDKGVGLMKCFLETKHSAPRAEGTPALSGVPQ
ncbi:GroES-like protein [Microstroma glucosiphilum]|uniref:GroES-like protein n=1 Tax=Pseudomicrostroma glucosiphilum TaxID=1684307 RepID=A0A316U2E8_9BASI|nr:GroES-like protein [Pseudomicrostroma glucosiphilum]PWN18661.1 GroES-like protein [Pseudomicrostroma glucosiphilum]